MKGGKQIENEKEIMIVNTLLSRIYGLHSDQMKIYITKHFHQ